MDFIFCRSKKSTFKLNYIFAENGKLSANLCPNDRPYSPTPPTLNENNPF
jgi:hypothetical protein